MKTYSWVEVGFDPERGEFYRRMVNPRDQKPQWGVPVNPFSGYAITEQQQMMLDRLKDAIGAVSLVLHEIDGSDKDGYGFSARRTSIAGTHLEQLQLIAMREILDK